MPVGDEPYCGIKMIVCSCVNIAHDFGTVTMYDKSKLSVTSYIIGMKFIPN